jgi:ubiquinone/menaquinone biosynthesis C-methylase UbiE
MTETIDFKERYAEGKIPWDSGKPSQELVRLLDSGELTGKTVLEIGCGTGTNAMELARRGFNVTAVDFVKQAIEIAQGKAKAAGVKVNFRVANVLQDDLGGPYDILFDRGVYHGLRLEALEKFQEVLKRVTRPGSFYLCLAGNAKEKTGEEGPPVVKEEEFRNELGSIFDILEVREFRFATNVPDFHPLAWSILMRRK